MNFPGSLRPYNINLGAAVVAPYGYIPFAFDNVTSNSDGVLGIRTVDGRNELIHLIAGRQMFVSAAGYYPNGVEGTTLGPGAIVTVW